MSKLNSVGLPPCTLLAWEIQLCHFPPPCLCKHKPFMFHTWDLDGGRSLPFAVAWSAGGPAAFPFGRRSQMMPTTVSQEVSFWGLARHAHSQSVLCLVSPSSTSKVSGKPGGGMEAGTHNRSCDTNWHAGQPSPGPLLVEHAVVGESMGTLNSYPPG